MSLMMTATHDRKHPVFRVSEVIGPDRRILFERSLSEELHRKFDPTAAERLPSGLAALVTQLDPGPGSGVRPQPSLDEDT